MIERIAEKPRYAAIDPVFVYAPAHDATNGSFDTALSRATSTSTSTATSQSTRQTTPRESHDRERDSTSTDHDRHRVGRGDPAAKDERPRDRNEKASDATSTTAAQSRDAPDGSQTHADDEGDATSLDAAASQTNPDSDEGNAPTGDEKRDEDPTATESAIGVVGSSATPSGDAFDDEATDTNPEANVEPVFEADSQTTGTSFAKSTAVATGQQATAQAAQPDDVASLSSTVEVTVDAEATAELTATAAAADSAQAATAANATSATSNHASDPTRQTAQHSATNPQLAARSIANSSPPDTAAATTLKANAGRESRGQRAVSARGEPAANLSNAAASPAQAATAIVARAEADAAVAPVDGVTSSAGGNPATSNDRINLRPSAPPTSRDAHVAHESGPRALVGRLAQGRGGSSARVDGPHVESEVQRVRLMQRVARAFQSLGNEGGELRLRLSPPSLGALKLEVTVQAGTLTARIETETAAAKALLVDSLPALRERLATHDIKVSHFDIETSADSQQQHRQFAGQDRAAESASRGPVGQSQRQAHEPPPSTVTRSHTPKGALDVLI